MPYDSAILSYVFVTEIKTSHSHNTCTMFIATLCITVQNKNQTKCSIEEWIKKLWLFTNNGKLFTVIKKNEFDKQNTWMNNKNIKLSKVSPAQNNTVCVTAFIITELD